MATKPDALGGPACEMSSVYAEGLLAGLGGATTIALWFLILDAFNGRPFYTPTVLGTALFHAGSGLETPETLPTSFETVVSFTWVHVLVFLAIGVAASRLIALAEQNPSFGFGIVLFFVFFQCAFFLTTMVVAEPVLHALAWPEVLIGNLLAAVTMTAMFWRRHPRLAISP